MQSLNALTNPLLDSQTLIVFVNHLLTKAIQQHASDIHIEPFENMCRIRFRLQGQLQLIEEISLAFSLRVAARIKVMAKLDISERRLPQDGRCQFQSIDLRISTCPTFYGEKVVLRLLNAAHLFLNIEQLNFSSPQLALFLQAIRKPQGLILVTGPTGSGKTSTLYAALHHLNHIEKNIATVEDPIEIRLPGINQINVHPKIGLTFSTALRALLRQDPDIIMIGEIRDSETAKIAIQAAQTGHLVLATLHTNSAIETITRLKTMGILADQLTHALTLIIAQRLIRKMCPLCFAETCSQCVKGYIDRIPIYEFLPMTEKIAQLIGIESDTHALFTQAKLDGFISLRDAGVEKVTAGLTTLTELNRVLPS